MTDGDRAAATLAEAKHIADGLQFACRLPDKTPDFTACGGPAAEAYWSYFTPARISSLLAAVEAALKLADEWDDKARKIGAQIALERDGAVAGFKMIGHLNHRDHAVALRQAIAAELTGEADGEHDTPPSPLQRPAGVVRIIPEEGEEAGDGG